MGIRLTSRDEEGAMQDHVLRAAREVYTHLCNEVKQKNGCAPKLKCLCAAGIHRTNSVWALNFCHCRGIATMVIDKVNSEDDLTLLAIEQVYGVVVYGGVGNEILVEDRADYNAGMELSL